MTLVAALLLAVAAMLRGDRSRCRLPARSVARGAAPSGVRRRWLSAVCACVVGPLLVLSSRPATVMIVLIAAALTWRRLRPRAEPVEGDVALTFDVMAACIEAGATMPAAVRAAAGTATASVAASLITVATELERGHDPVAVWNRATQTASALSPAARACARTAMTGAAVADELRRSATTSRAQRVAERRRRVQRASVWLVLPLGLCFLPAFVLVGVAPVVIAAIPGLAH